MSIINQDTGTVMVHITAFLLLSDLLIFSLPSRFAYIEFADKESVRTAMALDESLFRGRQIKVRVSHFSFLFFLIFSLEFHTLRILQ